MIPSHIQALIFDMDGTMIDSMPFHAQSWEIFGRKHGITMPLTELLARTTGRTGLEGMDIIFERALTADEGLNLLNEKEQIYRDIFVHQFREVAGFKQFESQARQAGLKVGIGTAGDQHNVKFALQHLGMEQVPSVIVRGDMGLRGKPNPDIFLEVARQLAVAPANCLVFEDAPLGIEAAKRANMQAVGIASTHGADELTDDHVIRVVHDYHELLKLNFFTAGRA